MTKISDVILVRSTLTGTEKIPLGVSGTVPIITYPTVIKTYVLEGLSSTDISDFTASVNNNANVLSNTTARHTHANKALLDTYDQANADISSAISDSHTHANKSLLDTYDQTNVDITDAVSKKHTHANIALLDNITGVGSGVIISGTERTKLGTITVGDSGSIITLAQIASIVKLDRANTIQVLASTTTPVMNVNLGFNGSLVMAGNTVINLTNLTGVMGGFVMLTTTTGYTLTIQNNGSSTNVAKMVNSEDLPAGAGDTGMLTWIYDGSNLTYNIGKRTEA